jgi:hypothetical protein
VAIADAPAWHKLPDALQIPAILIAVVGQAGKFAVLVAPEIFTLQLEIADRWIAVGRPFPDEISDEQVAVARKNFRVGVVFLARDAFGDVGRQVCQANLPGVACADIPADFREQRPGVGRGPRAAAGRKAAAPVQFGTDFK